MKIGCIFFIFCVEAGLAVGKLHANVQRIYVTEGGSFELTCKAEPKLIRSYRWVYVRERLANDNSKRDPLVLSSGNRLMVGETRFSVTTEPRDGYIAITLKFEDIRPNESGYFMCWRQGLKPDPRVYVRVLRKGAATAQPTYIDISGPPQVKYGSHVTITCRIRPYLPGNVTWFRNGQVIQSTDRVHSQHLKEKDQEFLASLRVATARQGANYTCMVPSNPPLEKTYQMTITVGKVEVLSLMPDKDSIQYGMTLTLTCVASGTDSEIVWLKDGTMLSLDGSEDRLSKDDTRLADDKWQSILRVPSFSLGDNGHYVCYVPGDSKNALVNIEGRPPRMLGVSGSNFLENEVLHLTCSIQYAKENREVAWFFNNEPLNSEWWIERNSREAKHNTIHHDLSILSAMSEHSGTYTCMTSFGSSSTTVRLIVPPYLVEQPPDHQIITVKEGEPLLLTCSVAGYPPPVVVWEKWIDNNWKIVEEAKSEGEEEVQGAVIRTMTLEENSELIGERRELIFRMAEPFHAGRYQCIGYANKNVISVSTNVVVTDPDPAIVMMSAEEVTEGENLTILCSVTNWDAPVDFISGLKLLTSQIDSRYSLEFRGYGNPFLEEDEAPRNEIATYALVITEVKLDDQGLYECQAGPEASRSIVVKVKQGPPEIIEIAASPAVEMSEFFVSCTVKNIPNAEQATFYFDGRSVGTSKDDKRHSVHLAERIEETSSVDGGRAKQATYVLRINRAVIEDTGLYHCLIRPGINISIEVDVAALETVDEIVNLKAYPAWIGGILLLECTVENWEGEVTFLQNTSLPIEEDDSRFEIERRAFGNTTLHSLRIIEISSEDSGYYQCFTTPFTYAGVNITLREKESLSMTFEQDPLDTAIELNAFVNLNCKVDGIVCGLNYTLDILHDGVVYTRSASSNDVDDIFEDRVTFQFSGEEFYSSDDENEYECEDEDDREFQLNIHGSLVLDRVEYGDSGLWNCRITFDETGYSRESSTTIEIYDPLEFVDVAKASIDSKMGKNVTLRCETAGYPLAHVYWSKDETEGLLSEGKGSAELFIQSFSAEDEGVYRCVAENKHQVISSITILEIIHELEIIESPDPLVFLREHESIDLKCVAFGSEPPKVEWLRDDKEDASTDPLATGWEVSIYHIAKFTEEDAGGYVCRAFINGVEKVTATELILTRKAETETSLPTTTPAPTILSGRLIHLSGPSFIEENDQLTLTCLVSPLLDAYRALMVVNNSLIAIDDQIMAMEPRVSLEVGKGGAGERLLTVRVESIRKEDSGQYECRANTEIITRHILNVKVVGKGELTATLTTTETATVQISQDALTTLSHSPTPPTTIPTRFPSSSATTQELMSSTVSTMPTLLTLDENSTTSTIVDEDELPFQVQTSFREVSIYVDEGLAATIVEGKDVYMDAVIGDSVIMSCTVYGDMGIPIVWKRVSTDSLLFVDYIKLTNYNRLTLEIFDGSDIFSRNLKLSNVTLEDEDDYLCLVQSEPPVNTTIHLKVYESEEQVPARESTSVDPLHSDAVKEDGDAGEVPEYYDEEEVTIVMKEHIGDEEEGILDEEPKEEESMIGGEKEDEGILEHEPELEGEDAAGDEHRKEEVEGAGDEVEEVDEDQEEVDDETEESDEMEEGAAGDEHKKEDVEGIGAEVEEEEVDEDQEEVDDESEDEDETEENDKMEESQSEPSYSESESDESVYVLTTEEEKGEEKDEEKQTEEKEIELTTGEDKLDSQTDIEHETGNQTEAMKEASGEIEDDDRDEKESPFNVTQETEKSLPSITTKQPMRHESITIPPEPIYTTQEHFEEYAQDKDKMANGTERASSEPTVNIIWITLIPKVSKEADVTTSTTTSTTSSTVLASTTSIPLSSSQSTEGEEMTFTSEAPELASTTNYSTKVPIMTTTTSDPVESSKDQEEYIHIYEAEGETYYDYDPPKTKQKDYPVIVATPGEDVVAPSQAEVHLNCPTSAIPEDITWRGDEKLLFLGSLDLAGVEGIQLGDVGNLKLLPGYSDVKNGIAYTCLVYDYDTYEDVQLVTYRVFLDGEAATLKKEDATESTISMTAPLDALEFFGLEFESIGVLSNNELAGKSLTQVLLQGGLNVEMIGRVCNGNSSLIEGWKASRSSVQECESKARNSGSLRDGQSVFIILDFTVSLPTNNLYGATLIYVHNVARNIKAHVFGTLVPLPSSTEVPQIECGSPVYEDQDLGLDLEGICRSSVSSSILTLQEAYLSQAKKLPLF